MRVCHHHFISNALPTYLKTSILSSQRAIASQRPLLSGSAKMASTMQSTNRLKRALEDGKGPSMGAWQMFPGSNISRILARTGVDWICVDCEHGNVDDAAMHEAVAALAACGVSPLVRIPDNQGYLVKRVLDAGAHGVLVPMLYSAGDAKNLVTAAKFPPIGRRGFGSPFSMEKFHPSLSQTEYLHQANDALLTIVQIETKEAVEDLEAIAAVPGIDVLFIGPFDLGNNLGYPIIDGKMHENLLAAVAKTLKVATAAGKKVGIYATSGEQAKTYADQGFHMICVATDAAVLGTAVKDAVKKAKGLDSATKLTGAYS